MAQPEFAVEVRLIGRKSKGKLRYSCRHHLGLFQRPLTGLGIGCNVLRLDPITQAVLETGRIRREP